MNSIFPQWIVDLATVATFVGFIITIAVLFQVRSIKNTFKNKARLPEIKKELSACTTKISRSLNDWSNSKNNIHEEFSKCAALLDNLKNKLDGDSQLLVKTMRERLVRTKLLRRAQSIIEIENKDQAWALYSELSRVNTHLDQVIKDMKWE